MQGPHETPPFVGSPRHLRKRALRPGVAGMSMVRDGDNARGAEDARKAKGRLPFPSSRLRAFGRKRLVALLVVILVTLSITSLALALIFVG